MFNVQEFRAQLVGDGARGNLFDVQIALPPALIPEAAGASEKLTFMARTSQLPGDTIGTVITHYFGREIKLPGNRTFPEWTVTIINDEDFLVRNALEYWMSALNSHVANLRDPSAYNSSQYAVNAVVNQYSKLGPAMGPGMAASKSYKFVGLFPVDLSPIDVDWSDNDSVENYTATFAYQWWEAFTTDTDNTGSNVDTSS